MIRRPPRSTRTDTLFPYPTLFRSPHTVVGTLQQLANVVALGLAKRPRVPVRVADGDVGRTVQVLRLHAYVFQRHRCPVVAHQVEPPRSGAGTARSEERRAGNAGSVRGDLGGRGVIQKKKKK